MMFNPSIAAEANMGGSDAEKQYPAPESLCKKHTKDSRKWFVRNETSAEF